MRRLAAGGDRAAALKVFAEMGERLRRELQTAPSPRTRALAAEIRAGDGGPAAPPPLPAAWAAPLAGRDAALARVRAALVPGAVTIVTGDPGIGKTALARHLAATERPRATLFVEGGERGYGPVAGALERWLAGATRPVALSAPRRRAGRPRPRARAARHHLSPPPPSARPSPTVPASSPRPSPAPCSALAGPRGALVVVDGDVSRETLRRCLAALAAGGAALLLAGRPAQGLTVWRAACPAPSASR